MRMRGCEQCIDCFDTGMKCEIFGIGIACFALRIYYGMK